MSIKTVKVSNVSLGASLQDVQEFFSFSGDIFYVEMQSHNERSQTAFVTFKDAEGAETAVLLSGATIVDSTVTVVLDPDYQLPAAAFVPPPVTEKITPGGGGSALNKAEDVVSSMLAKGYVLGKDAVSKAKAIDEKHKLTSTASSKVSSFDKKIGFTEKISIGTSIVTDKVREVDQKLQVSDKAKSAFSVAEQKVTSAGSAVMKNRYVFSGATWVTGAFSKVAKAAGEVGQHTKEKVSMVEDEKRRKMVDEYAQVHLSESPKASESSEHKPSKPAPAEGFDKEYIAYNDPIIQTMEEFSGYPPIQEPLFSNPEAARQNQIRIVEVSNLSLDVSPRFIRTFFSTCGNIESVEMQSNFEQSQTAFVTFEHSHGADCAVLTSGTKLLGLTVVITLAPSHQHLGTQEKATAGAEFSFVKAKDVFSSILANGYLLGKGAVNKAKAFDEMHQLTSTTTAKVASFDKKIGISEKVIIGTSLVNDKVREVDQKLLISEKVKSAFDVGTSAVNDKFHQVDQSLRVSGKVKSAIAVAGETVTTAKSAVLKNEYVSTGVSWVTGAFNSIAKAAAEVSQHAKEKVAMAEEGQIKKPA